MTKNDLKQATVAGVLITVLILIANPYHFWMPNMAHMALLAGMVVTFGLFATFMLREQSRDERDSLHRMFAGRAAFLAGAALLIIAIIYQSYQDVLDIWLVVVLVTMVLAKIGTRFYSDRNW
ncbi:MAG: hypothetical protein HY220_02590 [Candidatus Sungbacteria bacterium]|uniref:DUF2178 domain-containing protein n=1 Tax=Candidatus Sungiibacteriota bacterium TaxID=2750080 RepID=A0A9D6QU52_9BACT|nr:hypothetical protein [Candidatus Sungbacteria bacterium]